MQKTLAIAALAAVLTLAACARDAEPAVEPAPAVTAAAPAATATPAPIPGTDAIAAVAQPDPATDTAFDSKAFAGNFAAAGTHLEIQADGIYKLTVHAGSAGADLASPGTWTLEPDGRHILLDPESKAEADRRYEIVSNDELRATDGSGQSLRRE